MNYFTDYLPGFQTELNIFNNIIRQANIDSDLDDLEPSQILEYFNNCKVGLRFLSKTVMHDHPECKENPLYLEARDKAQRLLKIYGKQLKAKESKSREVVFTGVVGEKNYVEHLKNVLDKVRDVEDMKKLLARYRLQSDEGAITTAEILQQVILIVTRTGNDEAINRAVFKLHHDYQISPVALAKILDSHGILKCIGSCIMGRSSKEFAKHEKPQWLINVENELGI